MHRWTTWSIGPFGALNHLVEIWTTQCIGQFGPKDHLVHIWTTWYNGPFGPLDHFVHIWTNWSIIPIVHAKKNISSSLYPPILPSPSSLLPSLFSPFHVLFYLSGMYVVISLHYLLCFNTYLIYGDSNRGCCGESAQLYQ